jgi:DNA-binding MarR family transcriptional regulator
MVMPTARPDSPRPRPVTADVRQVEQSSRALANTTVQALDSVQSTISPTQVRALLALESSGGCSNVELAAMLGIFPSSASRLADRLTAAGLVAREAGTDDRREVSLVLTSAGRRTVDRFVQSRVVVIGRVMALMSGADRVALLNGLAAFTDASAQLQTAESQS